MRRWKIWLGIILIFLAGTCIGAVGTGLLIRQTALSVLGEGPPAVARMITKRLTRKLDLSPQQRDEVAKTVRETQMRLLALRSRYRPEARIIIDEGMEQIRKELTPEQQEKLNQLNQRMRNRFSRFQTP